MTREEEITDAAYVYIKSDAVKAENMQLAFGDFINGAKWADEHHNKELWDKEKVCLWFKKNILKYMISGGIYGDNLLRDLRKAMEE